MKYILIMILITLSGCYYIHQDWSMYDDQRQNQMIEIDAGDASK